MSRRRIDWITVLFVVLAAAFAVLVVVIAIETVTTQSQM
jgi:hypothetical protein